MTSLECTTPTSNKSSRSSKNFFVPPTPMLERIGFGTGVSVFRYQRGSKNGVEGSPWALKKVHKHFACGNFAERLKKEAVLLKSLTHPNIVGFRGFTKTSDGREVLAMEECTISLGDLIESRAEEGESFFEAEYMVKVLLDVCSALDYLHNEKKLLHGDIKSHNILIKGEFDVVKLCDFGVCLKLDHDGTAPVEDFVGTLAWSPPEALSDGPLTPATDIFSLGLVLWEMLALAPPNVALDASVTSNQSLSTTLMEESLGKRPPIPDIPLGPEYAEVLDVFHRCTEYDYRLRPTPKEIIKILMD